MSPDTLTVEQRVEVVARAMWERVGAVPFDQADRFNQDHFRAHARAAIAALDSYGLAEALRAHRAALDAAETTDLAPPPDEASSGAETCAGATPSDPQASPGLGDGDPAAPRIVEAGVGKPNRDRSADATIGGNDVWGGPAAKREPPSLPRPKLTPVSSVAPQRGPCLDEFENAIWDAYLTEHDAEESDCWPQWLIVAALATHDLATRPSQSEGFDPWSSDEEIAAAMEEAESNPLRAFWASQSEEQLRAALQAIANIDPVDAALDPDLARRLAREALQTDPPSAREPEQGDERAYEAAAVALDDGWCDRADAINLRYHDAKRAVDAFLAEERQHYVSLSPAQDKAFAEMQLKALRYDRLREAAQDVLFAYSTGTYLQTAIDELRVSTYRGGPMNRTICDMCGLVEDASEMREAVVRGVEGRLVCLRCVAELWPYVAPVPPELEE